MHAKEEIIMLSALIMAGGKGPGFGHFLLKKSQSNF